MNLPEVTGLDPHTFMALGPGARAAPYGLPSPQGLPWPLSAQGKAWKGLLERQEVNLPHSFCYGCPESSLSSKGELSSL